MSTHNRTGSIWSNAIGGVNRRTGPGAIFDIIDKLQSDQSLIVLCYSLGDTESFTVPDGHTYTSDAWDFVVTSDQDAGGYVADVFVNTDGDIIQQLGEQSRCDVLQQRLANPFGSNVPLG
jgi:hypothetical protein